MSESTISGLPIESNNGKDNDIDVASLNPEDEEFQRILELDEKRVAYKCLTSLSYHSQQDLQTLSQYTHEIDGIMDEVRKSSDDAKIRDFCKAASTVEEKRKMLQDKVDALQKNVNAVQASIEKVNRSVTYWEEQRDFIKVGTWIILQKKALRVLGMRDLKELNLHLRASKSKSSANGNANPGRPRSRLLGLASASAIDADDFIEAASIMMAGNKRKLLSPNDTSSSPHRPSKKNMINYFNFYLNGGEKKRANLHQDGFKLLYDPCLPDGEGFIVCATCNNKRVGQPRRMMRHAKSKRHQKNLLKKQAQAQALGTAHQVVREMVSGGLGLPVGVGIGDGGGGVSVSVSSGGGSEPVLPQGGDICTLATVVAAAESVEQNTSVNDENVANHGQQQQQPQLRVTLSQEQHHQSLQVEAQSPTPSHQGQLQVVDQPQSVVDGNSEEFEDEDAAKKFGFNPKTWNSPVCIDAWAYSTPDAYWDIFDWDEMLEHEIDLWSGLGWDAGSWQGISSSPDTKSWDDLTYNEQCCAIELGYDKIRWEGRDVQMVAKTGDAFKYGPWGGKCLVKYTTEECLWVYCESNRNNSGTCVWKCMSASDTQKLLAGYTVKVLWDNNPSLMFPMRVTNKNTFVVRHGNGRDYEFKRI